MLAHNVRLESVHAPVADPSSIPVLTQITHFYEVNKVVVSVLSVTFANIQKEQQKTDR